MLTRLFKKQRHPSSQWGDSAESLPDYDLSSRKLGNISLADDLEKARFLGKPASITAVNKNYYSLLYPSLGLQVEFELDKLTYLGFLIAKCEAEPKSSNISYCSPRLLDGSNVKIRLTSLTTGEEAQSLFGTPSGIDDDEDELVMTYVDGLFTMEFEFVSTGTLKRWNTYIDQSV